MITDGEPTAHIQDDGEVFFSYPPVQETIDATFKEVLRLTRDGIKINTFMLDATSYLKAFIEKLTQLNRGPRLLHDAGDAGRLRARRLHRAQALAQRRPPRPHRALDASTRSPAGVGMRKRPSTGSSHNDSARAMAKATGTMLPAVS